MGILEKSIIKVISLALVIAVVITMSMPEASTWADGEYPQSGNVSSNGGSYKVLQDGQSINKEAKIGDTDYDSLHDAINAAKDGDTVQLLCDITIDADKEMSQEVLPVYGIYQKNITIEGNGKTITCQGKSKSNGYIIGALEGANVIIKNLTVDGNNISKHGIQSIEGGSMVTLSMVTVINCYGYGVIANGAKVAATRLTTEGNGWGGINVGKGVSVLGEPLLTFNSGTLKELNPIQADNVDKSDVFSSYVEFGENAGIWYVSSNGTSVINWTKSAPVTTPEAKLGNLYYSSFMDALKAAKTGNTLGLNKDISVNMGNDKNGMAISIKKDITLEGNGHSIRGLKTGDSDGIGSVILVSGGVTVSINNLIIDGNKKAARHGIQTYAESDNGTKAVLSNVTVKDCLGYGLMVNGSKMEVTGLTTQINSQGGINVTQGSGVKSEPLLTFNGGKLNEDNKIRIDNSKNIPDNYNDIKANWVVFGGTENGEWRWVEAVIPEEIPAIDWIPGAAIAKITLNIADTKIVSGSKEQLIGKISPANAYDTDIIWTSSNPAIASVDGKGIVTAKQTGQTVITALAANGMKVDCAVTVTDKVGTAPSVTTIEPSINEVDGKQYFDASEIRQTIANAGKNENVVIESSADGIAPIISKEVFEAAASSDAGKIIIGTKGDTDSYEATFEFDSKGINKPLEVSTKISVKDDAPISDLPAGAHVAGMSFDHNGAFPGPTIITVALKDPNIKVGDAVYIYYINSEGSLELIDNGPLNVMEGKKVSFLLKHASDYVVSSEKMDVGTAADIVEVMINKIGTVKYDAGSKNAIDAAEDAYEGFLKAYGSEQIGLIGNKSTLDTAKSTYKMLGEQVNVVITLIEKIGNVSVTDLSNDQIDATDKAAKAYDALTDEQKNSIDADHTLALMIARTSVDDYNGATLQVWINKAENAIKALPTFYLLKASDESKVKEARYVYDTAMATDQNDKAAIGLAKYTNTLKQAEKRITKAKALAGTVKLSTTKYTYNKKAKKPSVSISGLKNGTDFTVSYKNNIKTGKATVTVIGINDCKSLASRVATFKIVPAKAKIYRLSKSRKAFKVKIKSQKSSGVSGYQIAYSTKKKSGFKTVTTKSYKKTVKKLKANKKYYVKVRAYKTIDGKKYYGSYSSIKTVRTY